METYFGSSPRKEEGHLGEPSAPHVVLDLCRSFVVNSYLIVFSVDTLEYHEMTLIVGSPSSKKPARLS